MPVLIYSLRNLQVRRLRTLTMLACIGLVVGLYAYLHSFADGLRSALLRTGDPHNVIVLAEGATAESNSALRDEDVRRLLPLAGIARDAGGAPIISPEIVVQTDLARRSGGAGVRVEVTLRGVRRAAAMAARPDVRLAEGRWFRPGADELVAGARAAQQYAGARIGEVLECGGRNFRVVGVFSAGGGAHEGELWGHSSNVADAYRRRQYSSALVRFVARLERAAPGRAAPRAAAGLRGATGGLPASAGSFTAAEPILERIAAAPIGLRGVCEPDYYASALRGAAVIERMAAALAGLMGLGAAFAAANTIHASVAARRRELAMLRAIGFGRRHVLAGVLGESLLLALAGGALGCAACGLFVAWGGGSGDFVTSETFASTAFAVRLAPGGILRALGIAAAIGLAGGLWPAWSAARSPITAGLRAA